MSYAIIRIQKMTSGSVKGIQIHDQREKDYSHTNSDIDFSKSHLNEDLHNSDKVNFNHKVKERINELNLPKAVRKDAIVMTQCLVTSDKAFFDKMSTEEQQRFFKDSFNFIKDRYGEKNIISATVHFDEKTPHMHVNFVPVTPDGRLCAKDLFKRKDLVKLHDDFYKYCKENGYELERGESKGDVKKHLSVEEYKLETKKQEIEKTKIELEKTSQKLTTRIDALKSDLKHVSVFDDVTLEKINLPFMKGKYAVSKEQYEENVALGKLGMVTMRENESLKAENQKLRESNQEEINREVQKVKNSYGPLLQSKDKEISNLQFDNAQLRIVNKNYKHKNVELDTEVKELKVENSKLKIKNKDLKNQGQAMFDTLKSHDLIPEAQDRLKVIREADKSAEKIAKKTLAKVMDKGMEMGD